MNIKFKRPMIVTGKYLDVYRNQKKIGKMRYWRQSSLSDPKYDVNIEMVGSDQTYEIIQQSFTIRDGGQREVIKNGHLIATMSGSKGLKEKDQMNIQLSDETTLSIKVKAKLKIEGDITFNGEHIGKTIFQ